MPDDALPLVAAHIPASFADRFGGPGPDLDRRALEALAVAAYQSGELTTHELRQVLGIETRHELDAFLKARGVYEPVSIEDVRRDLADLRASLA